MALRLVIRENLAHWLLAACRRLAVIHERTLLLPLLRMKKWRSAEEGCTRSVADKSLVARRNEKRTAQLLIYSHRLVSISGEPASSAPALTNQRRNIAVDGGLPDGHDSPSATDNDTRRQRP